MGQNPSHLLPVLLLLVSEFLLFAVASWTPYVTVAHVAHGGKYYVFRKGETDVATPGAAFEAYRGSWSYLNQHSALW